MFDHLQAACGAPSVKLGAQFGSCSEVDLRWEKRVGGALYLICLRWWGQEGCQTLEEPQSILFDNKTNGNKSLQQSLRLQCIIIFKNKLYTLSFFNRHNKYNCENKGQLRGMCTWLVICTSILPMCALPVSVKVVRKQ